MKSMESSTLSSRSIAAIQRIKRVLQFCFTALELEQKEVGNMAFLSSLLNRLFLRSEEFFPSQEGNCGKPILSLIFSVVQTQVMNPQEGIKPHSCCFLMFLSSMSPMTSPSIPFVKDRNSSGVILLLQLEERRFSSTIRGTRSLSTKKQSFLSEIFIPRNSERLSSFLEAQKWLIITEESLVWPLRSRIALTVIVFETVWKMSCRQERICLMSFWKVQTKISKALSSPLPPSRKRISFSRLTISGLLGLWNCMSRQWEDRLLIFSLRRSLQMQMMGTLVVLIIWIMAEMPPLSPELIPSTSSIIIRGFWRLFDWSKLRDELSIRPTPLLFLMSLALNSETMQLSCIASSLAVVVLPMPGSPLSKAALEFMFPVAPNPFTSRLFPRMWMSYQLSSHSYNVFIWEFSPTTSSSLFGLYFSVQS